MHCCPNLPTNAWITKQDGMKHITLCCQLTGNDEIECVRWQGPWFSIKMSSNQYRKSHCGDKTVVRPSYLHNGTSYTGKMIYLIESVYHFHATVFYVPLVGVEASYKLWWKTFTVFQNRLINYMYIIKMTTSAYCLTECFSYLYQLKAQHYPWAP